MKLAKTFIAGVVLFVLALALGAAFLERIPPATIGVKQALWGAGIEKQDHEVEELRGALADRACYFFDGEGENPSFGILAEADAILVTCDSVNMVSEALASGKPVYVADLPGGARKFEIFHRHMRDEGLTRPFDGVLEVYSYVPPKDMAEVTARIRALLHNP